MWQIQVLFSPLSTRLLSAVSIISSQLMSIRWTSLIAVSFHVARGRPCLRFRSGSQLSAFLGGLFSSILMMWSNHRRRRWLIQFFWLASLSDLLVRHHVSIQQIRRILLSRRLSAAVRRHSYSRGIATGGYIGIYTPKISLPEKNLWLFFCDPGQIRYDIGSRVGH